jgi:PAS domain-containing protein
MAGRYRFILVEEPESLLPVRYRRSVPPPPIWVRRSDPLEVLVEAFLRLSFRSEGARAWAPALSENPLTFLLDAVGDAVILRLGDGQMVYANPAARGLDVEALERRSATALELLQVEGRQYERRCMSFSHGAQTFLLEVLRRVEQE